MITFIRVIRLAVALRRVPGGIDGPVEAVADACVEVGIFKPAQRDEVVKALTSYAQRSEISLACKA
jgi:hypothetical protein